MRYMASLSDSVIDRQTESSVWAPWTFVTFVTYKPEVRSFVIDVLRIITLRVFGVMWDCFVG